MTPPAKTPVLPFVLITSLFLMWGLANNMTDTLLAAFKRIMSMTDFQTTWIQVAFYGSYFCLALPAAIVTKKFTYKTGVLLGLGLFIIGSLLFYPASQTMVYGHFLAALFVLAGGLSILETTCNPYIIAMGPEATGTQRLNLAQSFNPIGSIVGVLLSKLFILSQLNEASAETRSAMSAAALTEIQSAELTAVMGPYVGVAGVLLLIWITISVIDMPRTGESRAAVPRRGEAATSADVGATIKRLLKNPTYVGGVAAQFFYVGAQICVWSFTIRYVMQELQTDEATSANYYLAALVLFTGSRFVCTFLMQYIKPGNLLAFLALLAVGCTLLVMLANGRVGVYALIAISGCMSLMFPTIYGLAVRGLGNDTKIGGSGLIMAILGGAVLPLVQGQVSDLTGSIHWSYVVPALCFGAVAVYGRKARRRGA